MELFRTLARISVVLCLVVVVLGAWVRLTDAGLGCPDWPGCYGEMVVPNDPGADDAWWERTVDRITAGEIVPEAAWWGGDRAVVPLAPEAMAAILYGNARRLWDRLPAPA